MYFESLFSMGKEIGNWKMEIILELHDLTPLKFFFPKKPFLKTIIFHINEKIP
jgi:hypothetical protein